MSNAQETVSRDAIRAAIFKSSTPNSKIVVFKGMKIEIRQPTLGDVIRAQENPDRQSGVIQTLIDHAYVPGTNEKVFDLADVDGLKAMPFGKDFIEVSNALTELSEVNFLDSNPTSSEPLK